MDSCKEMSTPMGSRSYIDQDESGVSIDITKYRANPKESHLTTVKRIMKYLKGTTNVGLWYPKGIICNLVGYSDADYTRSKTDRKSTSSTCHILGNALVSWACKKQACVALSTVEAEYIAAGDVEVTFVDTHNQLADIFTKPLAREPFTKFEGN
ncbi:secreted RxLR effector protein 161-like [Lathyrus oleraceus]|uniref:secreted RxLR effector protein 161-like n=1 Tax=Pisum sativum TaxID=3888 RepID=UPI0021D3CC89|nr:secreted RxLR effector protein 161-like [Pisum sativum]